MRGHALISVATKVERRKRSLAVARTTTHRRQRQAQGVFVPLSRSRSVLYRSGDRGTARGAAHVLLACVRQCVGPLAGVKTEMCFDRLQYGPAPLTPLPWLSCYILYTGIVNLRVEIVLYQYMKSEDASIPDQPELLKPLRAVPVACLDPLTELSDAHQDQGGGRVRWSGASPTSTWTWITPSTSAPTAR